MRGTLNSSYFFLSDVRDHPRVCGEHTGDTSTWRRSAGSSPRVRGTLDAVAVGQAGHGIIPACAGNTVPAMTSNVQTGDHPRVCGEHCQFFAFGRLSGGSSPRVRGTPGHARGHRAHRGIIPACAGNTNGTRRLSAIRGDHPRVCGEHSLISQQAQNAQGSSPRVRGTRARYRYRGVV